MDSTGCIRLAFSRRGFVAPTAAHGATAAARVVRHCRKCFAGGFLIRCVQPPAGVPESEQNAHEQRYPSQWVVTVRDGTPVRRRGGGAGAIGIGQTVSVWCSGPVATSNPPQRGADFVVVDVENP